MHLRGIRGELSVRVAAPAPRVAARRQRAGVRVARGKLDGPIGQRDGRGRVRRGSPAEHLVGERSGRRDEAAVIDAERDSRVDAIGAQRRRRRSPKDTATLRRCSRSRVRPALLVCDLPLFAPVVCGAVVDPLEQPTTSTDTPRADVRMQCNVGRATPIWKIILARLFTSWRGGRARNLTLPSNGRPLRADCARLALALYSVEAGIKFGEVREGTRGGLCAARTRHARVRGLRAKPGSFGARCYGATRIASASASSLSETRLLQPNMQAYRGSVALHEPRLNARSVAVHGDVITGKRCDLSPVELAAQLVLVFVQQAIVLLTVATGPQRGTRYSQRA